MKTYQFIKAWTSSRKLALFFGLGFTAMLYLVYGLYGFPREIARYTSLLGLCLGAGLAILDFVRFAATHSTLDKMPGRFPTGALPESSNLIHKDYQAIIAGLEDERVRLTAENERYRKDSEEYYNLWVHQVKTPIAAMSLLLQQDWENESTSSVKTKLEQELFRVQQYVDMALQYQRLGSLHADLLFEAHSLQSLVNNALKNSAPLFMGRNLSIQAANIEGQIVTDKKWFCFVLEQVLSNSAKYTRRGSISINTVKRNNALALAIEDTGIGIAAEDLPRVFERGFTGTTGRRHDHSTGIGLYLCREIMTQLGFSISIESTPGQGTTVWMDLSQQDFEAE